LLASLDDSRTTSIGVVIRCLLSCDFDQRENFSEMRTELLWRKEKKISRGTQNDKSAKLVETV
jgi:hypothetical protein